MDAEEELLVGRGQALIAISVTSTVLAIGTCGVRFVARRHAKRGLWWDDYSVIVAMVRLSYIPPPYPNTRVIPTNTT